MVYQVKKPWGSFQSFSDKRSWKRDFWEQDQRFAQTKRALEGGGGEGLQKAVHPSEKGDSMWEGTRVANLTF